METDTETRTSFGPYEIRGSLGHGGGGHVYRAWDPRLEREVALKILHERSAADPARVQQFIGEARAASALNHPNIVTVFDAAVDGDTPYIVSELVEGRTLREEMGAGALPLKRLLDLATQIAEGLTAAHDAGIIHRDIKPENIMVTRSGRAKILDFGLAWPGGFQAPDGERVADDTETQMEPGLRAGTIPYMSPEQARGSEIDFRSDQFAFGLILFEMATGRPAFRRETPAATLDAIINHDLPAMSTLYPRGPIQLAWIIERCLAKEPHERYGATADLYRDCRTVRDRLAEVLARETAGFRPWTIAKRAVLGLAFLGAAAIGAALWGSLVEPAPGDASTSTLRFTPLATSAGYEGFPAWSPAPDGQTIAFSADVDGVLQLFTRRLSSPTAAQVTHERYDCKYPFWSHDGQRIYYVSLAGEVEGLWSVGAAGGTPQVVVENASRGAMSPDGRTLAFLRDDQPADVVGGAGLWLSTPEGIAPWSRDAVDAAAIRAPSLSGLRFVEAALSFSPDGRKLGLCAVRRSLHASPEDRGWQFWIVPLPGGEARRILRAWSDVAPRVSNFSWLPDSRHAVLAVTSISSPGWDLWMADLERERTWPLTRSADSEYYPSASPTGEQIVFTRDEPDYDLVEVSLQGRTPGSSLATPRNESDPAWSVDGTLAYVTDRSGADEIWLRTPDRIDRQLISGREFGDDQTIMLGSPAFSPDGRRIAYQRNASKPIWPLRIWTTLTVGGATPVPLLPATQEGYQGAPTWSPDGEWIAYTAWTEREWTLAKVRVGSGEPPIVLRTDGVPQATPHWSPKGDWITWETEDGYILVSPVDGVKQQALSHDQWLVHAWSPDGSLLFGIRETDALRLSLIAVDARTGADRVLADLGPSPPVNNPVKGLAVSADGKTIATSVARLKGDLYVLEGVHWREPAPWWRRLWRHP